MRLMKRDEKVPEFRIRLPDKAIASLLGLTLSEYLLLSHKPIEAFTDINGEVTEFYIQVSPNNDPDILEKLPLDKSGFVRFKPPEVYALYV
jgi:hypothetical protein